eukprot:TRINITY_DN440_c1_g1_i1.p1 TRINITY_DN440_c1_g1~~TRINITY_DN440_c1_g1_i1.p1  ORF type:complete len:526 (+),score=71.37 TRINITY_DN440_c1_g1_i1:551-2128(+)
MFRRKDSKKQPQPQPARGPPARGGPSGGPPGRSKYSYIPDTFKSVEQVQEALRTAGLESSNLIVGVDFTKSNEWTGKRSFGGRCLHYISPDPAFPNPYEAAIGIIGRTLEEFDDDKKIPCYGFGDTTTNAHSTFSFNPRQQPSYGFAEVLSRYRQLAPHISLAGPTSFAPIVEAAVRTVEESGGQYHVLLIIADGQVTRGSDIPHNQLSPAEKATVDAIVAASNYALSIVLVGVGDGPWDAMRAFDDVLPQRNFDNFQFVDFSSIMANTSIPQAYKDARFAVAALMEIPFQYKACLELGLVGRQTGKMPQNPPKEPPPSVPPPGPPAYAGGAFPFPGAGAPPYPGGGAPPYPGAGATPSYPGGGAPPYAGGGAPPYPGGPGAPPPYQGGGSGAPQYPGGGAGAPPYAAGGAAPYPGGGGAAYPGGRAAAPYPGRGSAPPQGASAPHYHGSGGPGLANPYSGGPAPSAPPPPPGAGGSAAGCPICFGDRQKMAFQCGHQTCVDCGPALQNCPICRAPITARVPLFG